MFLGKQLNWEWGMTEKEKMERLKERKERIANLKYWNENNGNKDKAVSVATGMCDVWINYFAFIPGNMAWIEASCSGETDWQIIRTRTQKMIKAAQQKM